MEGEGGHRVMRSPRSGYSNPSMSTFKCTSSPGRNGGQGTGDEGGMGGGTNKAPPPRPP